jgi:[ribosomal protein S5]-alanine N-acetyltransferase
MHSPSAASVPRSPRLEYRELSAQNLEAFHALAVDAHVRRFLLDGRLVSPEWSAEALRKCGTDLERRGVGLWLLFERGGAAKPVGFAGFWVFEELGAEAQLVYALLAEHTGRGYATEAAEALVGFARARGSHREVLASVDEPNTASLRVLEKLGFELRGEATGAFGRVLNLALPASKPPGGVGERA